MHKRAAILILASVVLASCEAKTPVKQAEIVVLAAETAAEQAVSEQLKDPSSGEYDPTDLRFAIVPVGMIVCGTVNAKNGFGGYAGKENWIAIAKWSDDGSVHGQAMIQDSSSQFWPAWRKACRHNRVGIAEMESALSASFEKSWHPQQRTNSKQG
jgi:hypothetical protein